MNKKQKKTRESQETWTQQLTRYMEEGVLVASKLWKSDAVAAYRLWERDRKQELPKNLPECDRMKSEGILMELERHVENEPHKINANDPRLHKAERDDLGARQKAHFQDAAFTSLTWAVACADTDDTHLDWPTVSKLFYDLEIAFDPSFYDTGCGQMTSRSEAADIQNKVDALLATRQAKLALALWECDSALATRYADVLRGIKKPLGLSDVETRTPFLQEIERRQVKEGAKPGPDATPKAEDCPDPMTIEEAAIYCGCHEKTIRNRLRKLNPDGTRMIANVIGTGRLTRISRASLDPFRKRPTATKKRPLRKSVKRRR